MLEFILCVGLPGSGKSYFLANNYSNGYNDVDNWWNGQDALGVIESISRHNFQCFKSWQESKTAAFDCLITTNSELNKIIDLIFQTGKQEGVNGTHIHFIIHYWKENRDLCLRNDRGRRNKSSEISIRNLPLEYPVVENKDLLVTIEEHEVVEAPSLDVYFSQYKNRLNGNFIMTSESWSAGGSWANCWGNSGSIDPDPAPTSFDKFDKLLENLCPDINFLTYKKLYNETVTIDKWDEHDYYGGTEYRHCFRCDLEKLYKLMVELNLLED